MKLYVWHQCADYDLGWQFIYAVAVADSVENAKIKIMEEVLDREFPQGQGEIKRLLDYYKPQILDLDKPYGGYLSYKDAVD